VCGSTWGRIELGDFAELKGFGTGFWIEEMAVIIHLNEVLVQQGFQVRPGPAGVFPIFFPVGAAPDFPDGVEHSRSLLEYLKELLFHGLASGG
jgi:hypothetical protein